jgi:holliday junction DNA helicase RuvA
MYEFIKGKIVTLAPTAMVLETNGIGWNIFCSVNTSRRIKLDTESCVWIHMVVREDLQALYGFHSQIEREIFRHLISISGIGPKVAVAILSGMEAEELSRVIANAEITRLTTVPGIGKKTAERLVLELKSKFEKMNLSPAMTSGPQDANVHPVPATKNVISEAIEALVALGYKSAQAELLITKARKLMPGKIEELQVESLLKAALQNRP